MNKQSIIEQYIDKNDNTPIGKEMNALLILQARTSYDKGKATGFIKNFSNTLGFTKHFDTAIRILHYCYPEKRMYWYIWDKVYSNTVENSAWLKLSL